MRHNNAHMHTHSHSLLDSCEQERSPSQNLYLITHNSHKRQISTQPAGFEPLILASEQPQTYALDCADT